MQQLYEYLCIDNVFFEINDIEETHISEYVHRISHTREYLLFNTCNPTKLHQEIIKYLISSHQVNPYVRSNLGITNCIINNFTDIALSLIDRDDMYLIDNINIIYKQCAKSRNKTILTTVLNYPEFRSNAYTENAVKLCISLNYNELLDIFLKNDTVVHLDNSIIHLIIEADNILLFKYLEFVFSLDTLDDVCFYETDKSNVIKYIHSNYRIVYTNDFHIIEADANNNFLLIKFYASNVHTVTYKNEVIISYGNEEINDYLLRDYIYCKKINSYRCKKGFHVHSEILNNYLKYYNSGIQHIDYSYMIACSLEDINALLNNYDFYKNHYNNLFYNAIYFDFPKIVDCLWKGVKINNLRDTVENKILCLSNILGLADTNMSLRHLHKNYKFNVLVNFSIVFNYQQILNILKDLISTEQYYIKAVSCDNIDVMKYLSVPITTKNKALLHATKTLKKDVVIYLLKDKKISINTDAFKTSPEILKILINDSRSSKRIKIFDLVCNNPLEIFKILEHKIDLNPENLNKLVFSSFDADDVDKFNYLIKTYKIALTKNYIDLAITNKCSNILESIINFHKEDGTINNKEILDEFSKGIHTSLFIKCMYIFERLMREKIFDPSYNGNCAIKIAASMSNGKAFCMLLYDKRVDVVFNKEDLSFYATLPLSHISYILNKLNLSSYEKIFLLTSALEKCNPDLVELLMYKTNIYSSNNQTKYIMKAVDSICEKIIRLVLYHPLTNLSTIDSYNMNNILYNITIRSNNKIFERTVLTHPYICHVLINNPNYHTYLHNISNESLITLLNMCPLPETLNKNEIISKALDCCNIVRLNFCLNKFHLTRENISYIFSLLTEYDYSQKRKLLDIVLSKHYINLLHYPVQLISIINEYPHILPNVISKDIDISSSLCLFIKQTITKLS